MIIAYYLSRHPDRNRFLEAPACGEDRGAIRRWLMTVLVKRGLWASTDALLGRARTVIRENCSSGFDGDAVASAMARTTGGMAFTDEEIEDLADTSYGDWSAYSLLSLLFPHVDTANHVFHIDHVVARAQATPAKMDGAGLDEDDPDRKYISDGINRLPNLQLLPGRENERNRQCFRVSGWIRTPSRMIATGTATRASRNWEIGTSCRRTSAAFAISTIRGGSELWSASRGCCRLATMVY